MKKRIENRLAKLEAKSGSGDKPMIAVFQDLDNRELYSAGDRFDGEKLMPWPEVENKYKDYVIFRVVYDDNWRDHHERMG